MRLSGVRNAVIAQAGGPDERKMEREMTVSLRESVDVVADPKHLDASVDEVFRLMLGVTAEPTVGPLPARSESVTAVVGFGGILSGACVFRSGAEEAMRVASLMTGMEFSEVDDTVKDGIGEICNMLAGAWKSKVPGLSASCGLSVPAVITGRDYNLHVQAPEFQLNHFYTFGGVQFAVTVVCDGIQ
ncbi:MAG: chemotaxis protein CheX [Terracidiphilus sp.]|nr:chemotaxis protein CheX [Terracidiphilus sp.]